MNIELLSAAENVAENNTLTWNLWLYTLQRLGIAHDTGAGIAITIAFVLACVIIPYLIGSINPAIIFSKLFYHDDIRTHGSGNAGATNTLRTYGKKMSALVLVCDMLKAAISTAIGWVLMGHGIGAAIAGFFVIFGHMFPIYYKFRGGKGVACAAIVVLMMNPIVFLICLVVFVVVVLVSKYVSLGSVLGIMCYPVFLSSLTKPENLLLMGLFSCLTTAFVVFMHRKNLVRIMNKEESKLSFKKKKKDADEGTSEGTSEGENDGQ